MLVRLEGDRIDLRPFDRELDALFRCGRDDGYGAPPVLDHAVLMAEELPSAHEIGYRLDWPRCGREGDALELSREEGETSDRTG